MCSETDMQAAFDPTANGQNCVTPTIEGDAIVNT
jgi:hypothetical protein